MGSVGETMHSLLMLHGLTGNANMMENFAKKICPDECDLIIPDAPFKHEKRGYCWWEYSDEFRRKGILPEKTLREIQQSTKFIEKSIPSDGKIIVGGFSQGAAMAQIMLLSGIADRISGLILLGTRAIIETKLRGALKIMKPIPILWMHGKNDEIIPFNEAVTLAEILEDENWDVTRIIHEKGHVIPLEHHDDIAKFIKGIF